MANVGRLVESGIVPQLAGELAAQINAATGNRSKLVELGMVPAVASEVVSQLAGGADARRLVEFGLSGAVAREVAAQIGGGGVIPVVTFSAVVGIGDSILIGGSGGSTTGAAPFANLNYGSSAVVTNFGVSGQTLATNVTRLQSGIVDNLYVDTGTSVLYLQGGTNDLTTTSGSATYDLMKTAITAGRTRYFRTVCQTILPRRVGAYGWTDAMELERIAYNNLLVANSGGADIVVDLRSHPVFGDNANFPNSTYTGDGLHPNDLGYAQLRAPVKAGIDAGLALTPLYKPQVDLKLIAKAVLTGVPGSTQITLGHSTWSITASASDGTALSVSGSTLTYAAFATAGTKTITFVETPPSGLGLSPRTSSVQLVVGTEAAKYIRFDNYDGNLTERLAAGGGYTYDTTSGTNNHNPQYQAIYTKPLPAGADGYAGYTVLSSISFPILGLSTSSTPGGFSAYTYAIFMDGSAGGNYSILGGGSNANLASAQGDTIRLRRAGTTVFAEVQRSGGTTWLTAATWTGASTAALTFVMQPGQPGTSGGLNGPFTTTNFA